MQSQVHEVQYAVRFWLPYVFLLVMIIIYVMVAQLYSLVLLSFHVEKTRANSSIAIKSCMAQFVLTPSRVGWKGDNGHHSRLKCSWVR